MAIKPALNASSPTAGGGLNGNVHWRTRRDAAHGQASAGGGMNRMPGRGAARPVALHLETLVLDGVSPGQRAGLLHALEAELHALCTGLGQASQSSRDSAPVSSRSIPTATADFTVTGNAASDGRAIARAIFRALRLPHEAPGDSMKDVSRNPLNQPGVR
jgi:hypothetical protein